MEYIQLITFLGGSSVVAILLTQGLKKIFDKYINEKYSAITAQGFLLLVSILIAGSFYCINLLPEYIIAVAGVIFGAGMGIYDVLKAAGIATGIIKIEKK
jgi:uncharacterized membrane protein required for colicin V production